jgi:hypothetical protein
MDPWTYIRSFEDDPELTFLDHFSKDDLARIYLNYMLTIMRMQEHLMDQGLSDSSAILIADSITSMGEEYYNRALMRTISDDERTFRGTIGPESIMIYFEEKYDEEIQQYIDDNFGEVVY